jgi:DNA-binding NtrC family response regulator
MNPHKVLCDSEESAAVRPEACANQAGSSSDEGDPVIEPSSSQVVACGNEAKEPDKRLTIEHSASDPGEAWPLTLDQIIKQSLVRLLRETGGNRRRTASILGISRSTLYRMLGRYGIDLVGRPMASRKPREDPSVPPA